MATLSIQQNILLVSLKSQIMVKEAIMLEIPKHKENETLYYIGLITHIELKELRRQYDSLEKHRKSH